MRAIKAMGVRVLMIAFRIRTTALKVNLAM